MFFCQNIEKKSFLATLAPPGLLPLSQNLFFPQIYSLVHMGILIEVFLLLYERIRKHFFLVFVQIWQKMWFLVTLAPPGLPLFSENLIFSLDIVGRIPGDIHWVFYHYK